LQEVKELGAITINTDVIVSELLKDPAVIYEIKRAFGDDIIKKTEIDKKVLAEKVFEHSHLRIACYSTRAGRKASTLHSNVKRGNEKS
jgi:dephospho-CoA kinase